MFGKLNYNKGMKLYRSGDWVNAINKLKTALDSGDLNEIETYIAYVEIGTCYNNLNIFDEAINALQCAVELHLENEEYLLYYELGRAYYAKKDFEKSHQYFEKTVELNPNDFDSWTYKGCALLEIHRYDDAETALETALSDVSSQEPERIDRIHQLLHVISLAKEYTLGEELLNDKKYADALNVFNSILEKIDSIYAPYQVDYINHIHEISLRNKMECIYYLEGNDSAIEALKDLSDFLPDDVSIYMTIANQYTHKNRFDEASKYYAKAEYYSKDEFEQTRVIFDKYSAMIGRLLANKDCQGVLNKAKSIPEKNDLFICWKKIHLGMAYFYLDNYDEALKCLLPYADAHLLDEFYENSFGSGRVNTYLGGIYYKRKDYQTALKYLKKCDQTAFETLVETGLFMGECYIALGKYAKAIEALQRAIEPFKRAIEERDLQSYYDLKHLESRLNFAKEKLYSTSDEAECPVCPKCGAKVVPEDTFCRKCGNNLKENN